MKAIKVGMITHLEGAHKDAYFSSLAAAEEVEEVVLADPEGKTVEMARKALGKKLKEVYKETGEMLRKEQPAMALVSVQADLAPPIIDTVLEAGIHVFAEKPSCVRPEDFEKLVQKAQRKHRHLMLALANRIHPAAVEARRLVQEGKLGKIYGVEVHIIADQSRLKREDYRKQWFCHKAKAGGGHLIWLGIHWIDLALYITGLKVEQVAAFTGVVGGQPIDVEDAAAVTLRFNNGSFGTVTSGYYLDKGYHMHVQVWGEHGWLRLEGREDNALDWYSTKDAKEAKVQKYEAPKGPRGYPPFVRAAVRASAGLEAAPISPGECLHVLKTIFASYRAADAGKVQKVEGKS